MLGRTEPRLSTVSVRLADSEASLHPGLTGQCWGILVCDWASSGPCILSCPSLGLGPSQAVSYAATALRPSPHRSPFTGLALSAGSSGPRLLPARAPMLPPVPRLLWLAQGGELGQGTQCGSLFPSSACWNWPISCLGLGAFSKVNKQIQRSWGLGWRKGC